jgi:hypothetical protein
MMRLYVVLFISLTCSLNIANTEEPALPTGLGDNSEEPVLPPGLGGDVNDIEKSEEEFNDYPFEISGFWEARLGTRLQNDPVEQQTSIEETRLQLQIEQPWENGALNVTGDFVYDAVEDDHDIDLEEGIGYFDLREANILLRPLESVDVKAGRQILTWGTGDLVFINDLFPKDWNSFFVGRDEEYLKAPSDALKASFFSDLANVDLVYTPRFDSDRFIDGRRISFFNSAAGGTIGEDAVVETDKPDDWFTDDEIALRIFRNAGAYELAAYGYHGFWKSPKGFDIATSKAIFPNLNVYGVSARGPLGNGIANLEAGYYDSEDDRDGDNPFVPNSEIRFLAGYEQEVATDFTAGMQYYLEHMIDHDAFEDSLPPGTAAADDDRHVITLRLTKLLMEQNLQLSLFTFYSPSDKDMYLRPKAHYKISDSWAVEGSGNIFLGDEDHTFFGQFEDNTNMYAAVRYSF